MAAGTFSPDLLFNIVRHRKNKIAAHQEPINCTQNKEVVGYLVLPRQLHQDGGVVGCRVPP
jgi:hypothetical protein